jgi:hypothetical protein
MASPTTDKLLVMVGEPLERVLCDEIELGS